MLRASQGAHHPQVMSEEFPRDHVYPRDRVVDMETIGADACGLVKRVLVGGRLEACAKVHTRARDRACSRMRASKAAHAYLGMRVTWSMVCVGLVSHQCLPRYKVTVQALAMCLLFVSVFVCSRAQCSCCQLLSQKTRMLLLPLVCSLMSST